MTTLPKNEISRSQKKVSARADTFFARPFKNLSLGVTLSFIFLGCSSEPAFEVIDWSSKSGQPKPFILKSSEFSKDDISAQAIDNKLLRSYQRYGQFQVEGGYLQKIYSSTGELTHVNGRTLSLHNLPDQKQLNQLHQRTDLLLGIIKEKYPDFARATKVFEPQWVLRSSFDSFEPVLQVAYISEDSGTVTKMNIAPAGQIVSRRRLSHHFDAAIATVFPKGPSLSSLADVILENLSPNGNLENSILKVSTASATPAFSQEMIFRYEPTDERFDQVQAFYYIDKFLNHYRDSHRVEIPFVLEAMVHVGYPERRNVAFYYDGNIRLGTGDNKVYRDMAKDPTIVMHEAAHAIVDTLAGLSPDGEGGSINEGFCDYLTANVLEEPKMAGDSYLKADYRRNIDTFVTADQRTGKLYDDSLLVSSALWSIHKQLGAKVAGEFAIATLMYLGPGDGLNDLPRAFSHALEQVPLPENRSTIRQILVERKWL